MVKRTEYRGSFHARGNDGNDYTVAVYVNVIDAASRQDPSGEIDGIKSLRTADGEHVNYESKGRYVILQTGVTLTSDDPDAP